MIGALDRSLEFEVTSFIPHTMKATAEITPSAVRVVILSLNAERNHELNEVKMLFLSLKTSNN